MGLRELRKQKKFTQKELAVLSKVPIRNIQKYEEGCININNASGHTIYKLSKALKCRMEDLLDKDTLDDN